MHVSSPLPKKKARIEIIPLIDIMFFLLASFMMVSLSQTHMKGIKVTLPDQRPQPPTPQKDYVSIKVAAGSVYYIDGQPVSDDEIKGRLYRMHETNPQMKISISAEMMAMHGDVIKVLDFVRAAKFEKVGYQIRAAQLGAGTPGQPPTH